MGKAQQHIESQSAGKINVAAPHQPQAELRLLAGLHEHCLSLCYELRPGTVVWPVHIDIEQIKYPKGKELSQGLHKSQGLPYLIIGKAGGQIAER